MDLTSSWNLFSTVLNAAHMIYIGLDQPDPIITQDYIGLNLESSIWLFTYILDIKYQLVSVILLPYILNSNRYSNQTTVLNRYLLLTHIGVKCISWYL